MKNPTRIAASIAAIGLTAGVAVSSIGIAGAAHGGALTEGSFSGRAEVAADATNNRIVGDPNGRGNAYVFSTGEGIVCYVLEVDKIEPATAAHIHAAPTGANGPVVVALSPPTTGTSAGCVDTGDAELAADITLNSPGDYYVNVHNTTYPGGAVRAQLGG
ncbi:MAG: CHRD domain-containing protein [Acidimicrobiales bacterium]|nr:CHRD domain-containing protein [Acidimicrobiales bacterium]